LRRLRVGPRAWCKVPDVKGATAIVHRLQFGLPQFCAFSPGAVATGRDPAVFVHWSAERNSLAPNCLG
jgi:hypothetical protein